MKTPIFAPVNDVRVFALFLLLILWYFSSRNAQWSYRYKCLSMVKKRPLKKLFEQLQKAPSNMLQNLSLSASILGFVTSTVFTILAIYLTIKYGENTDALVQLEKTNKALDSQTQILSQELKISNNNIALQRLADSNRVALCFGDLNNLYKAIDIDNRDGDLIYIKEKNERGTLIQMKTVIESQLTNSFLLIRQDSLLTKWIQLHQSVIAAIQYYDLKIEQHEDKSEDHIGYDIGADRKIEAGFIANVRKCFGDILIYAFRKRLINTDLVH